MFCSTAGLSSIWIFLPDRLPPGGMMAPLLSTSCSFNPSVVGCAAKHVFSNFKRLKASPNTSAKTPGAARLFRAWSPPLTKMRGVELIASPPDTTARLVPSARKSRLPGLPIFTCPPLLIWSVPDEPDRFSVLPTRRPTRLSPGMTPGLSWTISLKPLKVRSPPTAAAPSLSLPEKKALPSTIVSKPWLSATKSTVTGVTGGGGGAAEAALIERLPKTAARAIPTAHGAVCVESFFKARILTVDVNVRGFRVMHGEYVRRHAKSRCV